MKKKKGFTLVELIVTMAVMAVLAAVIVPTSIHFVRKAEDENKAAVLNDYMSRLIEVANRQDSAHNLKPDDVTCTERLMHMIEDANPELTGGFTTVAVLNDNIVDFNTDASVKDLPKYASMKSGDGFTVCFFRKEISGRTWWTFRLKFYENGKYKDIYKEANLRAE